MIAATTGLVLAALLAGCNTRSDTEEANSDRGLLDRLPFTGGRGAPAEAEVGIGVNSFLWRATLDTLSFMPLSEVDPFGGVIITDWYANPEQPDERFKATVYILDSRLRADALSVQLFKQVRQDDRWADSTVDPATRIQIENAILTRARQLRIATIGD
ncbi:DUF3576 domain-containing protein [Marinicauda algicola]|uniref:DUF3576 domain-containing protein n=2 Tax=Marinicauda algicola TaxID=2029849 RepID=A0A4S2H270_9PROT|nr:DUF3576 domain-containing protein [Marinicauda algicola]